MHKQGDVNRLYLQVVRLLSVVHDGLAVRLRMGRRQLCGGNQTEQLHEKVSGRS